MKQVDIRGQINMDVNWVMQMSSFGFSGFFCELLGLSSGLKDVFPELRVTKAFYRNANVEPLVGKKGCTIEEENAMTDAFFDLELMEKEREVMRWLTYPVQGSQSQPVCDQRSMPRRIRSGTAVFPVSYSSQQYNGGNEPAEAEAEELASQ